MYVCGCMVTDVGRNAAVALATLAYSPVVRRVTDELFRAVRGGRLSREARIMFP